LNKTKLNFCILLIISAIAILAISQTVNGQVTESTFANCIVMWSSDQVVLEEKSNCSAELFNQAVAYPKTHGYHMAAYSNVFHQIITLEK